MKMKKSKGLAAVLLAATMLLSACGKSPASAGQSSGSTAGTGGSAASGNAAIDLSQRVDLVMYLLGDPPVDTSPFDALNEKLLEKTNSTLTIKYTGWDSSATQLLLASGEVFDLMYVGLDSYAKFARDGSFLNIKDMLPVYAPVTWEKTPQSTWEQADIDGGIYCIPSRFTEFIPGGLGYRGDLLKKYNMEPIASIENMEAYFDKVLAEENGMAPFYPDTRWTGYYMNDMFINWSSDWLAIEAVPVTGVTFACESKDKPLELFYPVFTDEFVEFAKRMKEWNDKGYWQRDILSAQDEPYAQYVAGKTASYFQHAQGYIGTYGDILRDLPGSDPMYYSFGEADKKIMRQPALSTNTAVSITSKNPERALYVYDLLLNDREINHLLVYGILGKNYDINENGAYIKPENFNEAEDSYSIATWAIRVDENVLPSEMDYPGAKELNARLDAIAFDNPYGGFPFDSSKVESEIAAVSQVNSGIGMQIMFGKVDDPVAAVEEYRAQLTKAGIEKILEETKRQAADWLA